MSTGKGAQETISIQLLFSFDHTITKQPQKQASLFRLAALDPGSELKDQSEQWDEASMEADEQTSNVQQLFSQKRRMMKDTGEPEINFLF